MWVTYMHDEPHRRPAAARLADGQVLQCFTLVLAFRFAAMRTASC